MTENLRVLSLCSGVSAASVAFAGLPMEMVGYSEIDPFACHLLYERFGASRPRYMPDPSEPGIKKTEAKKRIAAIKAVADIPEEGRVPNFGDFSRITDDDLATLGRVDILEGGTPCQSFSIAGLRAGLNDSRGNLSLEFCRLAHRLRENNGLEFTVWENVPGVLSDKTNAFGCFLAGLGGESGGPLVGAGGKWANAGHSFAPTATIAWRILDSQFFGLAQRRRRVFVVASFGEVDAGEILFERHGTQRHTAPSRETGEEIARFAGEGLGDYALTSAIGIADYSTAAVEVFPTLQSRSTAGGRMDAVAYPVIGHAEYAERGLPSLRASGGDCGGGSEALVVVAQGPDIVGTLCASGAGMSRAAGQANELDFVIVQAVGFSAGNSSRAHGIGYTKDGTPPLRAGTSGTNQVPTIAALFAGAMGTTRWIVRRLLPVECERLQGFPDGWTDITFRRKPAADGLKYKGLGNSMAVPVMRWIAQRMLMAVEAAKAAVARVSVAT